MHIDEYVTERSNFRTEVPLLIFAQGFTKHFRCNVAFAKDALWAKHVQMFRSNGELYIQLNEKQKPLQNKLNWNGNSFSFTYGRVKMLNNRKDYTILHVVADLGAIGDRMVRYRLASTNIRE